jgi:hypothetical protein
MSRNVRSGVLACLVALIAAMTTGCSFDHSLFDGSLLNGWFDYAHSSNYWDRGVITDPSAMTGGWHN